jgi:hypothetical protein
MLKMQKYVKGSEGCRNLFFRPKGMQYKIEGVDGDFVAGEDVWVIQWEGYPEYDSGYVDYLFDSEDDALKMWEGLI